MLRESMPRESMPRESTLPESMFQLKTDVSASVDVSAETAEALAKAAGVVAEPRAHSSVSAGTAAMHLGSVCRADALKLVAETFLACKSKEIEAVSSADRYQVMVHIDQAVLTEKIRAADTEPHCCEIDDGPALTLATARRLACDATLVGLVEGPAAIRSTSAARRARFPRRSTVPGEHAIAAAVFRAATTRASPPATT